MGLHSSKDSPYSVATTKYLQSAQKVKYLHSEVIQMTYLIFSWSHE